MRSEKEMFGLILAVAKKLPQVKAVTLSGSRSNAKVSKDQFQDYDIMYVVNDKEPLLTDRSWLAEFGELLIMQRPEEMTLFPPSLGERFTFLMQFKDGTRIDLMLCPLSALDQALKEDPLLQVLYDPCQLITRKLVPSDQAFWTKEPAHAEFADCCNEFWWVSTYVVKGLCRGELLYATDHLYEICQKELLRLLSWRVGQLHQYSISLGKNYKYLPNYLDEKENQRLEKLRDLRTLESTWQALLETQHFFQQEARNFAEIQGFEYDAKTAENVMAYTDQWFAKRTKTLK